MMFPFKGYERNQFAFRKVQNQECNFVLSQTLGKHRAQNNLLNRWRTPCSCTHQQINITGAGTLDDGGGKESGDAHRNHPGDAAMQRKPIFCCTGIS
jgi:hypothetical protein